MSKRSRERKAVAERNFESRKIEWRKTVTREASDFDKNTPIGALGLRTRTENALKRAGFSTVGQAVEIINSNASILSMKRFGKRELMELTLKHQAFAPV